MSLLWPESYVIFFNGVYEGCPESIQPFWISRELVMWPWHGLAASQRRPYCASVNSCCPVGLVIWQWDAVDWACILCDLRIHSNQASRSASSWQCTCPFYSSHAGFFLAKHHITQVSYTPFSPPQPRFGSMRLMAFPKAKIAVEREEICEYDGHTVHELKSLVSHCGLTSPTGEWLFTSAQ
jgi:hypothetical protein